MISFPPPSQFLFPFPSFCDYSRQYIQSKDLKLGATDKREHAASVFLFQGYVTQYNPF